MRKLVTAGWKSARSFTLKPIVQDDQGCIITIKMADSSF